jgi:class 3 adenylate cyclase
MRLVKGLLLCSLIASSLFGRAQQPVTINSQDRTLIGKNIEYFVDSSNKLSVNDAIRHSFNQGKTEILNLGNIPYNVWIRFSITSQTEKEVYFEVMAPLLEQLELYETTEGAPKKIFEGGMGQPFHARPIRSENWLFDLNLKDGQTHTYYVKGHTFFPFQVPLAISSKDKYSEFSQKHDLFWGLYIGIILFAFIYNFFIYLSVRERKYFYYILYIIGSVTFYLGLEGFSFQFLWPNLPQLNYLLPVVICITNIIITLFAMNFLAITKARKGLWYFGIGLIASFALAAFLNLAKVYGPAVLAAQMLSLVACIYFIFAGVSSFRKRIPSAKFFLTAWTLYLVLTFIYILTINNVIASNFFTTHCIFIGHMTEVGLLSFALANRINWLKSENVKKQKEIIYQLKQNEEIQLEANRVLEQKVVERTAEVVEQKNEAVKQKKRSDELLLNILPEETAEELKVTGSAKAKHINQATVLFTDMKDFTQLSEKLTPEELVAEINDCFSEFDRILEKFGVEKIKTIGDSYMAAGGLPTPNTTHAKDVVNCALNILQFMQQLNDRKKAEGKISFDIRIGIHTGPVVAGIVGLKKFAYDIWGDTVNIASRMESSGEVGKINISKTTFDLVKDEFTCVYRGKVEAKNKGMIDMYFVEPGVKLEGVDGQQTRISYKH